MKSRKACRTCSSSLFSPSSPLESEEEEEPAPGPPAGAATAASASAPQPFPGRFLRLRRASTLAFARLLSSGLRRAALVRVDASGSTGSDSRTTAMCRSILLSLFCVSCRVSAGRGAQRGTGRRGTHAEANRRPVGPLLRAPRHQQQPLIHVQLHIGVPRRPACAVLRHEVLGAGETPLPGRLRDGRCSRHSRASTRCIAGGREWSELVAPVCGHRVDRRRRASARERRKRQRKCAVAPDVYPPLVSAEAELPVGAKRVRSFGGSAPGCWKHCARLPTQREVVTVGRNDQAGGHCEDGWRASWDRAFAVAAPAWTYLTRISRFVQVRELRRSIDEHLRSEGVYDRIRDFVKQHASEHGVRRHESSKLFFFSLCLRVRRTRRMRTRSSPRCRSGA